MLYGALSQQEPTEARLELVFTGLTAGLPMLLLGLLWLSALFRHDLLPLQRMPCARLCLAGSAHPKRAA